jgi:hypothetical protein
MPGQNLKLKAGSTQVASEVVRKHFDIRLGWTLLRDKRVPIVKKLLALGLGGLLMLVVVGLEIPLELLAAVFALPIAIFDGLEALILPVAFGCALLPRLTPAPILKDILDKRILIQ